MSNDINQLSERIKRIDKENKLSLIYEMMIDFSISSGDIVEYCANKGSVTLTVSQRLREINQTRKRARKLVQNAEKARQGRIDKRERMLNTAAVVAPTPKPKLVVSEMNLDNVENLDES